MDEQEYRALEDAIVEDEGNLWSGAPATAATGVAMTNTSGRRVVAYVSANGATISAISVNGTATGLTVGTFVLRDTDTLTLAYTVATPAIKWFYSD